jgi:hypothetical protein
MLGSSFIAPRSRRRGVRWLGLDRLLHLDHGAVVEAQSHEELAHVGLAEVDERGHLLDGAQLAAAPNFIFLIYIKYEQIIDQM